MAKEVIMPALGMAQETGTLLAWHKQAGDTLTKGEPLMTVATDKTDVEIEANASGILTQVTAKVGDEVPVGQVIALIMTQEEFAKARVRSLESRVQSQESRVQSPESEVPSPESSEDRGVRTQDSGLRTRDFGLRTPDSALPATPVAARLAAEHGVDLGLVKAGSTGKIQKEDVLAYLATRDKTAAIPLPGRVLASPKARRLAQEQSIDLATLKGSGPDGAVLAEDVVNAARSSALSPLAPPVQPATPVAETSAVPSPLPPVPANVFPMSRPWRIMAQRLQQSWTTVPHFYLEREANASQLVRWREQVQARTQVKITYTDLLVKLVAVALRKHPRVNASWIDENIVLNADVNVGLAVAVEEGLLVPVVPQADQLGLSAIAKRRTEVVERAQAGKLTPADLSGGTFTISNLGMYGIDAFNAIVNPPQAGILAVGRIADRVVPINGQPAVQPMTTLTLSCDHRVVDGARAAQFMQTLVASLEDPLSVLD